MLVYEIFCRESLSTYIHLSTKLLSIVSFLVVDQVPQLDCKPQLSNLDSGPLTVAPNT